MNRKHLTSIFREHYGYMLLEVMVSVLLVSTALIFLTARISQSIQGSSLSEEITVATRLAQGGAEWLKGWRDDVGWAEFITGPQFMSNASLVNMCWVTNVNLPHALPFDDAKFHASKTNASTCPNTIDNLYARRINLVRDTDAIGTKVTYTITVSWTSGRKERDVIISGELRERAT